MRAAPAALQRSLYRKGTPPHWRCSYCWTYVQLGNEHARRLQQATLQHIPTDRTPFCIRDSRFAISKGKRSFCCDSCENNWAAGDAARIGDWLYDEHNNERFRAANVERDAVHAGAASQRLTFRLRDKSHIPLASAPCEYPRYALNQPDDRRNNRLQLWWAGRWKATWLCKHCISRRYFLPTIEVDDFFNLRKDAKRKIWQASEPALRPPAPGTLCTATGRRLPRTARAFPSRATPADQCGRQLDLAVGPELFPVRLTTDSLGDLLNSQGLTLDAAVVVDLAALAVPGQESPWRAALLRWLTDHSAESAARAREAPSLAAGRHLAVPYATSAGSLLVHHVGVGSPTDDSLTGWTAAVRFATHLLFEALGTFGQSRAQYLLVSSLLSPRVPSASGRGGLASSRQEQLLEPFVALRTCSGGLPSLRARGSSSSPRTRGITMSTWTSSSPWRRARLLSRVDPATRRRTGELTAPPLEGQAWAGAEAAAAVSEHAGGNPLRLHPPPRQGSPEGRRRLDRRRLGDRHSQTAVARALLGSVARRLGEAISPPLPAAAGRCSRPHGDTQLRTIVNSPPSAAAHSRRARTWCSGLVPLSAALTPPSTGLVRWGSHSATALSRPGAASLVRAPWALVGVRRWMGQPPQAHDRGTMPRGPTRTLLPRAGDGSPHCTRAGTPPPPGVGGDRPDVATTRLALAALAPIPAPEGGCLSREPSGSLPRRALLAPGCLPLAPRAFVHLPCGCLACSLLCLLSRASSVLAYRASALASWRLHAFALRAPQDTLALSQRQLCLPGLACPVPGGRYCLLCAAQLTRRFPLGYFVYFVDSSDPLSRRA